jgi:hypothetical protein
MEQTQANTYIRFYQDKFLMGFKSEQAGHPVYDDVDFIEIRTPGDMNNIIQRPATENDKRQYAQLFASYRTGLEPAIDGIPLEAWARLTPASVANYKAMGVMTIEHVSNMSDQICSKVAMGAMSDRAAAKAYIAQAKDTGLVQKQAVELERQNTTIADLQRQISELSAMIEKPKRGRPARELEEA